MKQLSKQKHISDASQRRLQVKQLAQPDARSVHGEPSLFFFSGQTVLSMERLFDFIEDVQCWMKDKAGHYLWVNQSFLLNYSLDRQQDVIGKTDYALSPRHLADQFSVDDAYVLKGGEVLNRIELVGRFDHVATWCRTNKLPLRDVKGRIIGTVGITQPIGGEKEESWPTLSLGQAMAYIRKHYAGPMTVRAIAKYAHLSLRAFERQFREHFRESPLVYIRKLRVRLACRRLIFTNQPIAKIAAEHGFCDQSHFTRQFKRQIGMTPAQYRVKYRSNGK